MKKILILGFVFAFSFFVCSSAFAQSNAASANKEMIEDLFISEDSDKPIEEKKDTLPQEDFLLKKEVIDQELDEFETGYMETESAPAPEKIDPKQVIAAIDITGNKTIGISSILSKIKTRVGDPYKSSIVSDDIKRLYNTGYFSDVSVEKEDHAAGVKVIINLTEKPVVEKITFSKIRQYAPRTLALKIKSKKGRFFDKRDLNEDSRIITELYGKKGLTNAVVESDVQVNEDENKVSIHFEIEEGVRVKIKSIQFSGNETFPYKRLMKVVKTRPDTLFTSGYLKQDVLDEDIQRIEAFYSSEGFLDVEASYSFEDAPKNRMILTFNINELKRYYVGEIEIAGNDKVLSTEEIQKTMQGLKAGGTFTPDKLAMDISDIRSAYYDKGYIFCQINDSAAVNSETGKVDVSLNISEGEIAYLNKIKIQGNTTTRDLVIRRELRLLPGDAFDGTKLRRSKERLRNLGFFEEVDYDVEDTAYPDKKDLVVHVKEAKTGSLSFGGGYSTVDKLVGFVEIQQKNFDFTNWPTFTGGGQDLLLRAEIGSLQNNARLSFTEPWIFDFPVSGGFDIYTNTIDRDEDSGYAYDESRTGFDVRFGKQFGEYLSAGTVYRLEEVEISNVRDDVSADIKDEEGVNLISTLSFNAGWDSRDNVFSPTKGLVLGGVFDVAGGFLGGDKDFYRTQGKASYNIPLFSNTVLEFRMRVGLADAYGNSTEVPIYERFYAGGAYTIRGYNERKVGPLDPVTNDPIGGEAMIVGNIEYTVPVMEYIKVAAFFDTGNVWRHIEDFASGGYKSGMGLGLRIKTPIGPINLDYGYPLNDEPGEEDRTGKFYFSISRSF